MGNIGCASARKSFQIGVSGSDPVSDVIEQMIAWADNSAEFVKCNFKLVCDCLSRRR